MNLKITTLIEDSPGICDECENGLSFFVESEDFSILFDTGKSGKFIENANSMNVDIQKAKHIVISHGHYDHANGLVDFIESVNNDFEVFLGDNFFRKKYSFDGKKYSYKGSNFTREYLEENGIKIRYVNEDMAEIFKGVYLFSNFERNSEFELAGPVFYVKEDGRFVLDDFSDEIAMAVDSDKGLVVLLGCSHPGIVNMLESIQNRTNRPIYAVMGGAHLIDSDEDRIKATCEKIKSMGINHVGMSHCTGEDAARYMRKNICGYFENHSGNVVEI